MITAAELTNTVAPVAIPKTAKKVKPLADTPAVTETVKVETPAVEQKTEKRGRGRKPSEGPTKQSKANEIFVRLGGDKEKVIAAIQTECSMTVAGATTYFYNAKRVAAKQK